MPNLVATTNEENESRQGWQAHLNLEFKKRANKTVITDRSQLGPLTIQRPFYPEGDLCHLYLLHPPGGVVGGDELHINVSMQEESNVLITTPGATKFYRTNGQLAKQKQILKIADGCSLEWFPQENIFFHDTHSQVITRVELNDDARFMGWEINCYGRPASNELFTQGVIDTQFQIMKNGKAVLLDRLKITEEAMLKSTASLNNFPCFGTFISTHANEELLERGRKIINQYQSEFNGKQHIGITLIDDILVARCLGQYAQQVSSSLNAIWTQLRPEVLQRDACNPRIWST